MELEDCMKNMEGSLSPSQEKLLYFLLENREQTAVMTVQELADACEVSIATASRFVKQLGFSSYGQFQETLQRDMLKRIDTVQKIRNTAGKKGEGGFIHSALNRDRTTMELEEAGLKEEVIAEIADRICKASCVYLAGLGSSRALVDFLNYRFCWMGIPTRKLTAGGNEFMEQVVFLTEKDLLISVGFRKTYREIEIAMEYAKEKGACTVGIGESPASGIMRKSSMVIPIKRGPESEWNSLAYPMAVCNILVRQVLERRKDRAIYVAEELQRLNSLLKEKE